MKFYNLFFKVAAQDLNFTKTWNKMAKSDDEGAKPNISNEDNEQSWHELLDPELQPEQPIPDNIESQEIYGDHRRLAKEYLKINTDLYYTQNSKEKFLIDMDPEERKEKEELLKKFKDKEELLELYNILKSSGQMTEASNNRTEYSQQHSNDLVPDESWVVIGSNNQNS